MTVERNTVVSIQCSSDNLRKILIDTDTASDDAVALIMALRSPRVSVLAITVVAGNVSVEQGKQNALLRRSSVPLLPRCFLALPRRSCARSRMLPGFTGEMALAITAINQRCGFPKRNPRWMPWSASSKPIRV